MSLPAGRFVRHQGVRIELHCHSTCSDGATAPETVAAAATARRVSLFALTDHDSCEGTSRAVVPGAINVAAVELSCADETGQTVHVLAYQRAGEAARWPVMIEKLVALREARGNRLRVMAARLRQRGITLDIAPLLAIAETKSVGRPDLAKAMVAQGAVATIKDAFGRHLYDGGPVDEPHHGLSVADAMMLGEASGARLALAHPHLYGERTQALVTRYRPLGLEGLEAYYGKYDTAERARWQALADQHNMVCTGGSDSHGEPGIAYGIEVPDARAEALCAWLGVAPSAAL